MKKVSLIVAIVVSVFIALLFLGNKLVQDAIEKQLTLLSANGVNIQKSSETFGLFRSSRHYEFLVSDSQKFTLYLAQLTQEQLPADLYGLLQGFELGCDIEYNNFPLSNALDLEIYPLSFSYNIKKELKNYSFSLFDTLDTFLKNKGILYHIHYNLLSDSFYGSMKDIEQSIDLKKGVAVDLDLHSFAFEGKGSLFAPEELRTHIKNIDFKVSDPKSQFTFSLEDIQGSSNFFSETNYASSASFERVSFMLQEKNKPLADFALDQLKFNVSSTMEGNKGEFYSKSSFDKLSAQMQDLDLEIDGFNYDLSLLDLDKDALEHLRLLFAQVQTGSQNPQAEIESAIVELLAQGLKINIADLSIESLSYQQNEKMGGFALQTEIQLAANPMLASTAQATQILQKLSVLSSLKLSKDLFVFINQQFPLSAMVAGYAKDLEDDLVFDIVLEDGKLTVNDKAL